MAPKAVFWRTIAQLRSIYSLSYPFAFGKAGSQSPTIRHPTALIAAISQASTDYSNFYLEWEADTWPCMSLTSTHCNLSHCARPICEAGRLRSCRCALIGTLMQGQLPAHQRRFILYEPQRTHAMQGLRRAASVPEQSSRSEAFFNCCQKRL